MIRRPCARPLGAAIVIIDILPPRRLHVTPRHAGVQVFRNGKNLRHALFKSFPERSVARRVGNGLDVDDDGGGGPPVWGSSMCCTWCGTKRRWSWSSSKATGASIRWPDLMVPLFLPVEVIARPIARRVNFPFRAGVSGNHTQLKRYGGRVID